MCMCAYVSERVGVLARFCVVPVCAYVCMHACICEVCQRARVGVRAHACVCVSVYVCVSVSVCVGMRAHVRVHGSVCVSV